MSLKSGASTDTSIHGYSPLETLQYYNSHYILRYTVCLKFKRSHFRALIAKCGAEFIGVKDGSILFRADGGSSVCSLYPAAIRSELDIKLALKAEREKQAAAQWEFESAAGS